MLVKVNTIPVICLPLVPRVHKPLHSASQTVVYMIKLSHASRFVLQDEVWMKIWIRKSFSLYLRSHSSCLRRRRRRMKPVCVSSYASSSAVSLSLAFLFCLSSCGFSSFSFCSPLPHHHDHHWMNET